MFSSLQIENSFEKAPSKVGNFMCMPNEILKRFHSIQGHKFKPKESCDYKTIGLYNDWKSISYNDWIEKKQRLKSTLKSSAQQKNCTKKDGLSNSVKKET